MFSDLNSKKSDCKRQRGRAACGVGDGEVESGRRRPEFQQENGAEPQVETRRICVESVVVR